MFWVVRSFVRRSGALTGRRDDLFFLQVQEILAVLAGDRAPPARVPARQTAYRRYRALPPYPGVIRGQFDPVPGPPTRTGAATFSTPPPPATSLPPIRSPAFPARPEPARRNRAGPGRVIPARCRAGPG